MLELSLFDGFPDELSPHVQFGPFRARVLKIVDGDTLDCLLDLGYRSFVIRRLRLLGVNTPETKGATREAGLRSKARVVELCGPGTFVLVRTNGREDSFGRWLAYVTLADGTDVGKTLLYEKLAVPFMTEKE